MIDNYIVYGKRWAGKSSLKPFKLIRSTIGWGRSFHNLVVEGRKRIYTSFSSGKRNCKTSVRVHR